MTEEELAEIYQHEGQEGVEEYLSFKEEWFEIIEETIEL